jgi:uncharacterized protein YbaR (Trm112 family)
MEILACPICKNPSLDLIKIEETKQEVETGVIFCKKCLRYYPIKKSIPIMLPDDLRKPEDDIEFLTKYKNDLPDIILMEGKPQALSKK